ncbi:hypothetical protein Sme01_20460 [Sphaerisporangium melleum]|uniref:Diacylglycerol glucosyltransferase N-terminal domain-containing protein n=1 Tax=Sphaerisporangium melleum TaxID=321316 RepID=A0A917RL78_9ACTN|nr:hypothetical protein [Sphaerisporangium melleum]GGL12904.1 hypothetical protein GCM10007964_63710 [Sphaerisporangium melleum]GII69570.1 hypothetical protein Sme01_20460 [Sphaerisporangium melleum]
MVTATRRRVLILSASMGAGHDGVAAELARRLAEDGAEVEVIDVLHLVPFRLGLALRQGYHWAIRRTPWLYEAIYQVFFVAKRAPSTSPLTSLIAARLDRLVRRRPPDEVVSTFHLAAQATGQLRRRGLLRAPATVLVTDFAVHRLWLHPGNDRYLCPNPAMIPRIAAATGRPAVAHAPVVGPAFFRPAAAPERTRLRIGGEPDDRLVLVAAGSWGIGRLAETADILAESGRFTPVILCGRNAELRRRLTGVRGRLVLGWRDDVPDLMAAAHALVDSNAGLTCEEAFAAGLPVVSYRPIAGHGRDGALAMARMGASLHARDGAELLGALDRLADERRRRRQIARASALFAAMPAEAAFTPAPRPPGL